MIINGNNKSVLTVPLTGASASGAVTGSTFSTAGYRAVSLHLVTSGSGQYKVEVSNDGTNWVGIYMSRLDASNAASVTSLGGNGSLGFASLVGFAWVRINASTAATTSYNLILTLIADTPTTSIQQVNPTPLPAGGFPSSKADVITNSAPAIVAVKTSPGIIGHIVVSNSGTTPTYLKLYNENSPASTSTAKFSYLIPVNSTTSINCGFAGIKFDAKIHYAVTGGSALIDNTTITGTVNTTVNIAYA
jgi:hypothetical protein